MSVFSSIFRMPSSTRGVAYCDSSLTPSAPAQASASQLGTATPSNTGVRLGGFIEQISRKFKKDAAKPVESLLPRTPGSTQETESGLKTGFDNVTPAAALAVEVAKPIHDQQAAAALPPALPASSPALPPVGLFSNAIDSVEKSLAPVQFEQYAKEYMQMTGQDLFDGFRLEAGKSVTPRLQASHSLFLGTGMRQEGYLYQFGPTFGLEDGSLLLMARYGNDGAMTAR